MMAPTQQIKRNRTVATDLEYLMLTVRELSPKGKQPARIELSIDGDEIVAIVMSDMVPVPLAARGLTANAALRGLVDEIKHFIRTAKKRTRARRR